MAKLCISLAMTSADFVDEMSLHPTCNITISGFHSMGGNAYEFMSFVVAPECE